MKGPRKVKDLAAGIPVCCADGQVRTFAGRLLVLSDGLGVALGAMAILAPVAHQVSTTGPATRAKV